MIKHSLSAFLLISLFLLSCKKDPQVNVTENVTSTDLIDDLLFVTKNDYQITTADPATFSSDNPDISITSNGLVKRLTSGEVVTITINWTNSGNQTKLVAVGATDNQHISPFTNFHTISSDDATGQYIQGWKTLRKLPVTGETYAIILRHADADNGVDFSQKYNYEGPSNWWKSSDSTLARQLNAQGRLRAIELGKVLKDLQLPITRVISSEFYRSVRTVELMNLGRSISTDGRINHPAYIKSGKSLFKGLQNVINELPADNKITLISTHHPINEFNKDNIIPAGFPKVSVFNWTGAYFVKIAADKTITYEGAVSYGMFIYWRDLKLNK